MNLVPPQDTILGLLRIDEVYFEHDGPKFFAVSSRSGRRYLALMVDEGDDWERYLYLPVSDERFNLIRSGGTNLKRAFSEPEDGLVFDVVADYSRGSSRLEHAAGADLPDELLPTERAVLDLPTETQRAFQPERLAEKSGRERRTLLAIEVEPAGMLRTEIPLRSLSRIAGSLQDTVDALGQEEAGRPTPRGIIPNDVLRETELVFRGSQAASFVILAASGGQDNHLIESSILPNSCRRLVELLQQGSEPDRLRDLVGRYGVRVRAKYRALLESLVDEGSGVSAYIATGFGDTYQAGLKPNQVRANLNLLREVGQDVMAEHLERVNLVGVNLRTGSFELYDPVNSAKYSGYMEPEARDQISGLPTGFDHLYSADILVQQQLSNFSDEVTKTYRLIGIGAPYGATEEQEFFIQPLPPSKAADGPLEIEGGSAEW
ncbi:DUF6575 domain-containing protein [Micromonospora zamorensis]|uniref:DUF6575 domain-containing protein n=1 Tax=Micromonospora zamorensis TaxID=709883 RepID=UPI00368B7AF6